MPNLKCTATTCVYNKEQLCAKGDIKVDGVNAQYVDETCCASFRERGEETSSGCNSCGCKTIDVDCKACECVYNSNEKCTADAIDIAGANACSCQDTKCGTFCCK
ncbi:MAG: DUF1540 domain-containing protein [Blautia sp.]|jgi:hypothetical protein